MSSYAIYIFSQLQELWLKLLVHVSLESGAAPFSCIVMVIPQISSFGFAVGYCRSGYCKFSETMTYDEPVVVLKHWGTYLG